MNLKTPRATVAKLQTSLQTNTFIKGWRTGAPGRSGRGGGRQRLSQQRHADGARGNAEVYISEPDRGQRNWKGKTEAQPVVYGNRRRIRGGHGTKKLCRLRIPINRGMRRVHLRGRENILKRVLIYVAGFNLSLAMRQLLGKGTPRGLAGALGARLILLRFYIAILDRTEQG